MVGLDDAVLGADRRPLHQRQQVALHALAADLGTAAFAAGGDLVDFVDENDTVAFGIGQGRGTDFVLVDELAGFLFDQSVQGFLDLHLAGLAFGRAQLAEHALQLLGHLFHALRTHDLERWLRLGQIEFDFLVVEQTFAQALAHRLARGVVGWLHRGVAGEADAACVACVFRVAAGRHQHVEHALFGGVLGSSAAALDLPLAFLLDSHLHQVAHDRIDVLADIADLGELGGFDLDEGRVGQMGQTARDLGLADAGRADHQECSSA